MTEKYKINLSVIRWACDRAGLPFSCLNDIASSIKNSSEDQVSVELTMKQIEKISSRVHIGSARLFSQKPPKKDIDYLPDFRTLRDEDLLVLSQNLKSTIFQCKIQTNWFREYSIEQGFAPVNCVGVFNYNNIPAKEACSVFKEKYHFKNERCSKIDQQFAFLRHWIETLGVLVFKASYSGSNTKAVLNINEFRGFAIIDEFAPLIFINSNDSFSAQCFSLIHEFAHILISEGGISQDCVSDLKRENKLEKWCNEFAAEFLVPDNEITFEQNSDISSQIDNLAKHFKVSSLVILRKLYSLNLLERKLFFELFESKKKEAIEAFEKMKLEQKRKGNPIPSKIIKKSFLSDSFLRSVVSSVYSGSLRYTDAFKLLNMKSISSFNSLASSLTD